MLYILFCDCIFIFLSRLVAMSTYMEFSSLFCLVLCRLSLSCALCYVVLCCVCFALTCLVLFYPLFSCIVVVLLCFVLPCLVFPLFVDLPCLLGLLCVAEKSRY